jgi:response regulator NasT
MAIANSVLLISEDDDRSIDLREGLYSLGVSKVYHMTIEENFLKIINQHAVDFIVIDIKQTSDDLFNRISLVDQMCPTPVICFSEDSDSKVIANSVKAGVSAYIVDGKSPQRIEPIMQVALQRFKACQAMRKELLSIKDKLSERAVIEKAKGLLIAEKKLTEDEAYSAMRKSAMDQGKRISEIAHEVVTVYLGLDYSEQEAS